MLWPSQFCIRWGREVAECVGNGTCQFHVLENRNARLHYWRTWNKGKTISPSHER
jgi:hypothetical protein